MNCEMCQFYEYDEERARYYCAKDLDEDEQYAFMTGSFRACPYFSDGDEYKTVRKQM